MITRTVDGTFRVCLALFLIGGVIVVAAQAFGLLVGNGPLVEAAVEWAGTPTFVLAGAAGLLGFILSYLKGWDTSD
ncbi:hypothetical protein [Prauserella rugosa]|uniref:Uncharacterized protein n=1 Tax=Prauserella rugosa TaxID=43354 RepID=A0A660C591_9PSEU|nr:hypothetical protein [Prauserella rugosa]KMS82836.1 hypothetical protein ACZ91_56430 [Streptomyces regensis]TWH18720.1 hypothetical protein JD82_00541 [Prauserella rugosa]